MHVCILFAHILPHISSRAIILITSGEFQAERCELRPFLRLESPHRAARRADNPYASHPRGARRQPSVNLSLSTLPTTPCTPNVWRRNADFSLLHSVICLWSQCMFYLKTAIIHCTHLLNVSCSSVVCKEWFELNGTSVESFFLFF